MVTTAILLVLSMTAGPVVAQPANAHGTDLPLDGEATHIATVAVDGTSYDVYQQENTLPYADGIEVYANGEQVTDEREIETVLGILAAKQVLDAEGVDAAAERAAAVTSRQTAEETFEAVAWRQTVTDVDESDLESMQATVETTREIQSVVGRLRSLVDGTIELIEWMKDTSAAGISVWDAATTASPALEQLEPQLREIRTTLREWEAAAGGVTNSLPQAIDAIERAQAGEDVDYDSVGADLQAGHDSLRQLEPLTDDTATRLDRAADASRQVAAEMGDVPVYGDRLASDFGSFADAVDDQAQTFAGFTSTIDQQATLLERIRQRATAKHDGLVDRWETERASLLDAWTNRQTADTKVYGTIGGGAAVGIGSIGAAFWRWRG